MPNFSVNWTGKILKANGRAPSGFDSGALR